MVQAFRLFSILYMDLKGINAMGWFSVINLHLVLLLLYHQHTQTCHQPQPNPRSLQYLWLKDLQGPLYTFQISKEAKVEEMRWLQTLMTALPKQQLDDTDWISWSAYHASVQEAIIPPSAINTLLPLFVDSAHSIAMIKHSMIIVKAVVQHLNPGQTPVLTADQPLFALAKQIQWTWPDTLGENSFVVTLGGLHIEMAILRVSEYMNGVQLCSIHFFV